MLMLSGVKNKQTVFIFNDGQIKEEAFVEDLNNLLNSGEVPNIYAPEEKVELVELVRKDAQ
jgi:dynein heavy chain